MIIFVVLIILIPLITGTRMIKKHCNQFLKPYHHHHQNHGNDHDDNDIVSCLIMLNSSGMTAGLVEPIWREFSMHVCADGGANRLFDTSSAQQRDVLRPSAIVGDLDSLRYDARSFYGSHGSHIIEDIDQDYNDVDKSLKYAKSCFDSNNPNHSSNIVVVIVGAFGGRFDQEIASIHALYKWNSVFQRIVLMDGENIAMLLSPGKHELFPLQGIEGPTCGLLPVGGVVNSISTKGLKWNLDKHTLSIDGLVSSSNSIVGIDENGDGIIKYMVEVDTSDYIIWSCTFSVDN